MSRENPAEVFTAGPSGTSSKNCYVATLVVIGAPKLRQNVSGAAAMTDVGVAWPGCRKLERCSCMLQQSKVLPMSVATSLKKLAIVGPYELYE